MIAKSLDVFVLLKLVVLERAKPYAEMAREVGMSASEFHASVRRSQAAGLVSPETLRPLRKPLLEYLQHGVRYAFPVSLGRVVRGVPTAYAALPLEDMGSADDDLPPVWSHPQGSTRGLAIEPLYRTAPMMQQQDRALYELLALVDILRIGRTRERTRALAELSRRIFHETNS